MHSFIFLRELHSECVFLIQDKKKVINEIEILKLLRYDGVLKSILTNITLTIITELISVN